MHVRLIMYHFITGKIYFSQSSQVRISTNCMSDLLFEKITHSFRLSQYTLHEGYVNVDVTLK